MSFKKTFVTVAACAAAFLSPVAAIAKTAPVYTGVFSNVALSGYDAVAYFTVGHPVEGSAQYKVNYNGAEWHFSSAANRDAFRANPARFAPQYGGYCAWAVGHNYTASGDPKVWRIVGGKLYLNYNREIGQKWAQDIPGYIRSGDANWPGLVAH